MPTNVVMPQMGESVAEGTIVRWIKKVGDRVDRDEPLFEISTDKVDAEIPAPAAGIVREIRAKEGETVPVDTVVAVIGDQGEAAGSVPPPPAARAAAPPPAPQQGPPQPPAAAAPPPQPPAATPQADGSSQPAAMPPTPAASRAPSSPQPSPAAAPARPETGPPAAAPSVEDGRRQKSSPLVRRIAREHNVDITSIPGSGINGRVTKHDILEYLAKGTEQTAPAAAGPAAGGATRAEPSTVPPPATQAPAVRPGENVEVVPMSVMRKRIAEHMILSKRTSAHVTTVHKVDMTKVAKIRERQKAGHLGIRADRPPPRALTVSGDRNVAIRVDRDTRGAIVSSLPSEKGVPQQGTAAVE